MLYLRPMTLKPLMHGLSVWLQGLDLGRNSHNSGHLATKALSEQKFKILHGNQNMKQRDLLRSALTDAKSGNQE